MSIDGIITWIKRLVLLDWIFVIMLFLCVLVVFMLGVLMRQKKIVAFLCFLITFCLILSSPIILQIFTTQVTKNVTISLSNSTKLQYQDVFFIEGNITNSGKIPLSTCTFETILIPADMNTLQRLKHEYVNPQRFIKTIDVALEVGQSEKFSYVFPSPSSNVKLETLTKADCF